MRTQVKICGITTQDALEAAADGGASHIGFVFYPPSPRYLDSEAAAQLAQAAPSGIKRVGVFVNPDAGALARTLKAVPLDMIQLHGDESAQGIEEIRRATGLPVIKAAAIAGPEDVARAHGFEEAADVILLDAKVPVSEDDDALPGGMGLSFDWSLIAGETWSVPWGLSGGLTPENVGEAIATTHAGFVDVSSGVEERPGVKSPALIISFLKAVGAAGAVGDQPR